MAWLFITRIFFRGGGDGHSVKGEGMGGDGKGWDGR